ncbi:MAG TPA: hypothetical protein VH877_26165 [Polyangia bacterium]|jgi:preprotein translocase subunit SecG|nr:hypothetical protein [Polyangia bacterium]
MAPAPNQTSRTETLRHPLTQVLLACVIVIVTLVLIPHGTLRGWAQTLGQQAPLAFAALGKHVFLALTALPLLLIFLYIVLGRSDRYLARKRTVETYRRFRQDYDRVKTGSSFISDVESEAVEPGPPSRLEYAFGAVALTVPFLVVAALSDAPRGIGILRQEHIASSAQQTSGQPAVAPAQPTTPANTTPAPAANSAPAPAENTPPKITSLDEGLFGLVFAGYGVFIYTLGLLIYRLRAQALSPKFLFTASLRAAAMLLLGFAVGSTDLLPVDSTGQRMCLYFALGIFPSWAYQALRKKARAVLAPMQPGEDSLPLQLIDGIDDQIAERLEEIGVADAQHLATSDPGDVTMLTLYPFERVIDWIDQAILITYLRDNIRHARALGIRGAIDMRGTYREAVTPDEPGHPAGPAAAASPGASHVPVDERQLCRTLLDELATQSKLKPEVIYSIGASLIDDYQVNFLADFWHHHFPEEGLEGSLRQAIRRASASLGVAENAPDALQQLKNLDPQKLEQALQRELQKITWQDASGALRHSHSLEEAYVQILHGLRWAPPPPAVPPLSLVAQPEPPSALVAAPALVEDAAHTKAPLAGGANGQAA